MSGVRIPPGALMNLNDLIKVKFTPTVWIRARRFISELARGFALFLVVSESLPTFMFGGHPILVVRCHKVVTTGHIHANRDA